MSINRRSEMTFLGPLRAVALSAVVTGAAGSVGFTLRVGHRNDSLILMGLFVIWVLSPFTALMWVNLVSKRWLVFARATVYGAMLAIALGSLAIYGEVAFGRPRAKPAFVFLMVPLVSWLLIALLAPAAAFLSARRSR
jgi:hypothetical protein